MQRCREKSKQYKIVRFLVDSVGFQPRTLPDALVIAGKTPLTAVSDPQHDKILSIC